MSKLERISLVLLENKITEARELLQEGMHGQIVIGVPKMERAIKVLEEAAEIAVAIIENAQ